MTLRIVTDAETPRGVAERYADLSDYELGRARNHSLNRAVVAIEDALGAIPTHDEDLREPLERFVLWLRLKAIVDLGVRGNAAHGMPRPASEDEADALCDVAAFIRRRFDGMGDARSRGALLLLARGLEDKAKQRYRPTGKAATR